MIVVVIIGLLTALGMPAWRKVRENAQNGAIINDFHVVQGALQGYHLESGGWPVDVGRQVFPTELEGWVDRAFFEQRNNVGGVWDYEGPDPTGLVGLTLREANVSREQMLRVDARLDDGDLMTGSFRENVVAGDGYTLVIDVP